MTAWPLQWGWPGRSAAGVLPCGSSAVAWAAADSGINLIPCGMAMTLRLTDDEQDELRKRAADEGVSMQELARRAIREYVGLANHRDRVVLSAERVMRAHAEAIERLGR